MNVLFVTYGHLGSNSAVPLALHARELARLGHACAVVVPPDGGAPPEPAGFTGTVADCDAALRDPGRLFPDGRPADVVHAWTPRENVRRFATAWLARYPAPLVIYLEDNERAIALGALGANGVEALLCTADDELAVLLPDRLPHPFRFEAFVGLADAAVVIQDKLAGEVPPWVPATTVMPGVDLDLFAPRPASAVLRARHGLAEGERVIVYPGGLNPHTRGPIRTLCEAVGLLNRQGRPCRLLRTGPGGPLDFMQDMAPEVRAAVLDLGVVPRAHLPELLGLADVLVQPGRRDAFEDLRLPGKLPEFLAMGKPVVVPDANVAHLLRDGEVALVLPTGSAPEIAAACARVFADPALARRLGAGARRFAQDAFDPATQARRLLSVYERTVQAFDVARARRVWCAAVDDTLPTVLLARRLEQPSRPVEPAMLLPLYGDFLRVARARVAEGRADLPLLRATLRARERELAPLPSLAGACAEVLAMVELRLASGAVPAGRPARRAYMAVRGAGGVVHRLRDVMRRKGGAGGMLAVVWRIARTEGWAGVGRRLAALRAGARVAARRHGDSPGAGAPAERREELGP